VFSPPLILGEGDSDAAVVTRDRNGPADVWRLGTDAATAPDQKPIIPSDNFWLTETNYDHWVKALTQKRVEGKSRVGWYCAAGRVVFFFTA
jgi:hypothetical protein